MNDTIPGDKIAKQKGDRSLLRAFLAAAYAIAIILAALGAATVLFSFDNQTRYFRGTAISIALAATSAVVVVLAICAFFLFKSQKLQRAPIENRKVGRILRLLTILPIVICAYYVITTTIENAKQNDTDSSVVPSVVLLFIMFTLCAVYNVSHAMVLNKTLSIFSGMAQIAFCVYVMTTLYFNWSVELNSPFKLIVQFAAASLAIDTCMEVRDIISGVSTRAYVATKTLSMSLGSLCFAISLCAVIKGARIEGFGYLWYSLYFLALAICSAFDLSKVKYPSEQPSGTDSDVCIRASDTQNAEQSSLGDNN